MIDKSEINGKILEIDIEHHDFGANGRFGVWVIDDIIDPASSSEFYLSNNKNIACL